jgi:PmbA protein
VESKSINARCLEQARKQGADHAQCDLITSRKHELNVNHNTISLLRTTFNTSLNLSVIKNQRKGGVRLNKTGPAEISTAVKDAMEIARSSKEDPAYAVADKQEPKTFSKGSNEPDLNAMHQRVTTFLEQARERYPKLIIEEAVMDFTSSRRLYTNTNDVDFDAKGGHYSFWAMFTAKEGKKTSSFNYSGFSARVLEKELLEYGTLGTVMQQTSEQLDLKPVPDKFTGDLLITPDCLGDFISMYGGTFLSEYSLISGTSIFKDRLGQHVASPDLTLHSQPRSEELAGGYFVTSDGFEAKNSTMIDQGVLKHFNLGLYGSRKTGKPRSPNRGGAWVMEGGRTGYPECLQNIKQGIMLCRFSGGSPNHNGDFSGVAKNSYYIKDGQIKYPVNETMIAGNLAEVFRNIVAISTERINFGGQILPWMVVGGVTVSGK